MNTITDSEYKKMLISKMGEATGGLFYLVHNQICELRIKFADFKELYGKDQKTIEILNNACSIFFGRLQILMKDDLNLALSRLLDNRKNTASLNKLIESISDSSLKKQLNIKLSKIIPLASENKKLRDSRLAHTNKHHRLNSNKKLVYISRAHFKEIIDEICEAINLINDHFQLPNIKFEVLDESAKSKCLILRLEDSLKFEKMERKIKLNSH